MGSSRKAIVFSVVCYALVGTSCSTPSSHGEPSMEASAGRAIPDESNADQLYGELKNQNATVNGLYRSAAGQYIVIIPKTTSNQTELLVRSYNFTPRISAVGERELQKRQETVEKTIFASPDKELLRGTSLDLPRLCVQVDMSPAAENTALVKTLRNTDNVCVTLSPGDPTAAEPTAG